MRQAIWGKLVRCVGTLCPWLQAPRDFRQSGFLSLVTGVAELKSAGSFHDASCPGSFRQTALNIKPVKREETLSGYEGTEKLCNLSFQND